ncbi:uncharacterized protein DNG_06887 [Cephalotrichum gorgonifer]|uniref:Uncharacterized protein n=1 Tax=Cephalotrichum gorgonifer TaxID=2041049 RepID=A0AAE8N2B2_9PEZI|nr:uncharacterized protein DNG_06887 [Cephalotrichum gorgonifer]
MAPHEPNMGMDTSAHMSTPFKGRGPSERTTATSGIARRDDPSYLTAYVVLPGDLKMPISISGDSFRFSSKIQSSCKVYHECDGDDTAIRIIGKSPAYLQAAIKEINDVIRGHRTKEASGHQHLLVQPPNGPSYADGVILVHSNSTSQEGSRPIFQPRGQELATPIPDFTPSCHEQKVADLFRDSMSTLQAMGCNLRMRANFGFLKLRQQRRAPPEYDLRQFVEISNRFPSRALASWG